MIQLNINSTRNNGLFSNLFGLINLLYETELNKTVADVINVENFSRNYSATNVSSFYDFFINKIDNTIIINEPCVFYNNRIDTGFDYKGVGTSDIYMNKDKQNICNKIIHKYLNLKKEIIDEITIFKKTNINKNKTLGIHIRQTDHGCHGKLIGINKYIEEVNKIIHNYDKIFVMTDDMDVLLEFKKLYSDKIIYYDDVIRSNNNIALHNQYRNNKKIALDVIKEVYTLSECDEIIITSSNVSMYAICLNNKIKFNLIDL